MSKLNYRDLSEPFGSPTDFQTSGTVTARVLPKEYEEVKAALAYLATLPDDWSGNLAKAPSEGALKAADAFFKNFYWPRRYPSKIMPDGDGAVLLVWFTVDSKITITVEAAMLHPSIEYTDGRNDFPSPKAYDLDTIPSEIFKLIPNRDDTAAARQPQ